MAEQFEIEFENLDDSDAGKMARDLKNYLSQETELIEAKLVKASNTTQDVGTIVSVVVGSQALLALAKGIADWLRMRHNTNITIKSNGDTVIENISFKDAPSILSKLSKT